MRAIMSHLITTTSTVFTVDGDLADTEVTRLAEWLWPHMLTAPPETLLDLGAAVTVDGAGVDLLAAAHTYAAHRGLTLRLINATPDVQCVLYAAGVSTLPVDATCAERAATSRTPQHCAAAMMG
jgi:anti-anti-sigma regulatory factor